MAINSGEVRVIFTVDVSFFVPHKKKKKKLTQLNHSFITEIKVFVYKPFGSLQNRKANPLKALKMFNQFFFFFHLLLDKREQKKTQVWFLKILNRNYAFGSIP